MSESSNKLELGKDLERRSYYDGAEEIFSSIIGSSSSDAFLGEAYAHRGIVRRYLAGIKGRNYHGLAVQDYQSALKLNIPYSTRIFILINQTDVQRDDSISAAQKSLEDILLLTGKSGDNLSYADVLGRKGILFLVMKDYASAKICHESSRKLFENATKLKSDDKDIKNRFGQINYDLGLTYTLSMDKPNLGNAKRFEDNALTIFKEIENRMGSAGSFSARGNILFLQKKNSAALKQYINSSDIFEELGYKRGMARIYFYLAFLNLTEENMDLSKANEYLKNTEILSDEGYITEFDRIMMRCEAERFGLGLHESLKKEAKWPGFLNRI